VLLGKQATAEMVTERNPDVVIVATGAKPLIPDIKGAGSEKVTTAWDILSGRSTPGENVIVIGGGSVGSETALYLAKNRKKVTIVEMLEKICMDMSPTIIPFLMPLIKEYGITVLTNHRLVEVTARGIIVIDGSNHKTTIEADTVVMAVGALADNALESELKGKGIEVYSIGDCSSAGPGKIFDAVHDAYFTMQKV